MACHVNIAPFYVMVILVSLGGDWNVNAIIGATIVAFGVILSQRVPRARFRTVPPTDAN